MAQYDIFIETVEKYDALEQNYKSIMVSIITSCLSEVDEDDQGNNIPKGVDGGTS